MHFFVVTTYGLINKLSSKKQERGSQKSHLKVNPLNREVGYSAMMGEER